MGVNEFFREEIVLKRTINLPKSQAEIDLEAISA